jgi:hypothetical protein
MVYLLYAAIRVQHEKVDFEQGKLYQYIDILFVEEWQIMGLPD